MARIGYARVNTRGQSDDTQVDELTAYGCNKLFVDRGVSGKLAARPELDKAWPTSARATYSSSPACRARCARCGT